MIPHKQQILHDPDNGKFGSCFQTVVASVLDLPLEEVPHFLFDNPDVDTFQRRLHEFLVPRGLFFMSLNAFDFKEWKKNCHITEDIYHTIGDDSPRFPGVGHEVVGKNGEVFHDPHPDNQGLPLVTERRTFGFFIRLGKA